MAFVGTLHPFQKEAVDRMIERECLLVAYEMGLGKTVISIAAIESLFESGEVQQGFVVAPSSLKYQWKRQIDVFTGGEAKPIVIDGTPKKRREQYQAVRRGEHDYIIVNYEQILNDWEMLSNIPRDFVVADEITAIKNPRAKRTKRMRKFDAKYKFGLSGQPIENRAEELYSIMQWIDPDVLGRFDLFDRTFIVRNNFGGVRYYKNLPVLHNAMMDAMVRKSRADVADQLPSVTEQNHYIEFDSAGARLYRHISRELLADLSQVMSQHGNFDIWAHYHGGSSGGEADAARGVIMSKLTCLRMICDHPELIRLSAQRYGSGAHGSVYAYELGEIGLLNGPFQTPKFKATVDVVTDLLEADPKNKIVVFSFFKPTLRFLDETLSPVTGCVQFTGSMNARAKDAAKQKFLDDPKVRVFLSSDAGGYGVDLPNANYLISYDLPWSSGKLEQRNARIIRLSSEFDSVTIVNMLMHGSIEERQYDMLSQKKAIASAIIDGQGIDGKGRLTLNLASLTEYLTNSQI